MAVYGLEKFDVQDSVVGQAAAPKTSVQTPVNLTQMLNVDMIEAWDYLFNFAGTTNAFTGTANNSDRFPYNFVSSLTVPYQSSALRVGQLDGHQWWLASVIRPPKNAQYSNGLALGDQQFNLTTGYTPETNDVSSSAYGFSASATIGIKFTLPVTVALWFDKFYDSMPNGQMGVAQDTYVSPLLMASTGRNIVPTILLSSIVGSTLDQAPLVQTGTLTTTPTWTDTGSTVTIRRRGWRQPSIQSMMPPIYNWAYNWTSQRVPIGSSKVSQVLDVRGQILSIICRFFDPTLASGIGGPIPIGNLSSGTLQYGAGIQKFYDGPLSQQLRVLRQHGVLMTKGVWLWDLYIDTKSNLDAINTYVTSGVQVSFDFGANTPGAGSYMDLQVEWLTKVQ